MERVLQSHDIEILRRSLAIGNGLPAEQILHLIETCNRLLDDRTQLRAELDELRPVVTELRNRLTHLHQLTTTRLPLESPPTGPDP